MTSVAGRCRKYILHFAHEHLDFRIPEVKSVAAVFGINLNIQHGYDKCSPFCVVDLPSEECAKKIASRSVVIKSIYEMWGIGETQEQLFRSLTSLPSEITHPHLNAQKSFRIMVETFNKQYSLQDRIKRVETLVCESGLPFPGKISLKKPDTSLHLMEYFGAQTTDPPEHPYMLYLGRWVADGQRDNITKYDLKKRKYIGNTSMEAGLALIMANMGNAAPGTLTFDPFVGTGSILVMCAHHGSYVMGTDMDFNLLHGRGRASRKGQRWRSHKDDNMRAMLGEYGLEQYYLDVMIADASKHGVWRPQPIFDSIITDPPYGIREPAKKVGSTKETVEIPDDLRDQHIPSKVSYGLTDIFKDLLNFAAKYLVLNGRLVFWLPIYRPDYSPENIPIHPCFTLVSNCEQTLNITISRRLITMQKHKHFVENAEHNAEVLNDHYRGESFRNKYFTPNSELKDELKCEDSNDKETVTNQGSVKQKPSDTETVRSKEPIEHKLDNVQSVLSECAANADNLVNETLSEIIKHRNQSSQQMQNTEDGKRENVCDTLPVSSNSTCDSNRPSEQNNESSGHAHLDTKEEIEDKKIMEESG